MNPCTAVTLLPPPEFVVRLARSRGEDWAAQFAIGLQLPGVWRTWHENPAVEGVASRLWPATTDAACWAAVDLDGRRTADRFTVWEHGPHRLWSLVEAAYGWWREAGRPGPERFGLTVAPDGTHTPWLDTPDRPVPVLGPPAVSPGRGRSAGGGGAVGGRTAGGPRP